MNEKKLNTAKMEAYKLIGRIDACLRDAGEQKALQAAAIKDGRITYLKEPYPSLSHHIRNQHTANVRRQSMELTRTLAELRRPG